MGLFCSLFKSSSKRNIEVRPGAKSDDAEKSEKSEKSDKSDRDDSLLPDGKPIEDIMASIPWIAAQIHAKLKQLKEEKLDGMFDELIQAVRTAYRATTKYVNSYRVVFLILDKMIDDVPKIRAYLRASFRGKTSVIEQLTDETASLTQAWMDCLTTLTTLEGIIPTTVVGQRMTSAQARFN
jgi:hypothetical protein